MNDILQKMTDLRLACEPFVELLIVDARGSVPSQVGSRALVTKDSVVAGTVGGGKVELRAIEKAKQMIQSSQQTDFVVWNLQRDIGMTCGGEMKLYFQLHKPDQWTIAVFGAGHVAQSLVPMLCQLSCKVYSIDSRQEWLGKIPDANNLEKILTDDAASVVEKLPENTFFISMTQGHAFDVPILDKILARPQIPFVGVIGSASKAKILKNDLLKLGHTKEIISQIHCPIGLPFGDNSTAEISFSIVAQLITVRDQWAKERAKVRPFQSDTVATTTKIKLIQAETENINCGPL
jgi:xanthine dehydrogenase accessory factor